MTPGHVVRVSRRLLEDDDGPMLDVKQFEGSTIELPRRSEWRPDRDALAVRFERFTGAA